MWLIIFTVYLTPSIIFPWTLKVVTLWAIEFPHRTSNTEQHFRGNILGSSIFKCSLLGNAPWVACCVVHSKWQAVQEWVTHFPLPMHVLENGHVSECYAKRRLNRMTDLSSKSMSTIRAYGTQQHTNTMKTMNKVLASFIEAALFLDINVWSPVFWIAVLLFLNLQNERYFLTIENTSKFLWIWVFKIAKEHWSPWKIMRSCKDRNGLNFCRLCLIQLEISDRVKDITFKNI